MSTMDDGGLEDGSSDQHKPTAAMLRQHGLGNRGYANASPHFILSQYQSVHGIRVDEKKRAIRKVRTLAQSHAPGIW